MALNDSMIYLGTEMQEGACALPKEEKKGAADAIDGLFFFICSDFCMVLIMHATSFFTDLHSNLDQLRKRRILVMIFVFHSFT